MRPPRVLAILKFIPDRPWDPRSWWGLRPYIRFRIETMGRVPTLRETWAYLGWCRDMDALVRREKW